MAAGVVRPVSKDDHITSTLQFCTMNVRITECSNIRTLFNAAKTDFVCSNLLNSSNWRLPPDPLETSLGLALETALGQRTA